MNRRSFLSKSTAATGLLSNSLLSIPTKNVKTDIKVLATNWGFSWSHDTFCAQAKSAGYDGIEIWWPGDKTAQKSLFDALQKHQLDVGFLIGSGEGTDYKKHVSQFESAMLAASTTSMQKPLYINCHSGRDYYSFDQNAKIIELTINQSKKTGIKIVHETHRGRMCFAAHITRAFLEKYPDMYLTLDISHWCNVHESLLSDQTDNVSFALSRTQHIHARIGHQEGPQVNDPRAPEWKSAVDAHINWWDKVIEQHIKTASSAFTFLTEFGPPNYMPALPYTQQPVSDLWAVNVYMKDLLKKRYSK